MVTFLVGNNQANLAVSPSLRDLTKHSVYLPILNAITTPLRHATRDAPVQEERTDEEDENEFFRRSLEEDESEQIDERASEEEPQYHLRGYRFGVEEFEVVAEKLTDHYNEYLVKYELFDGYVAVRTLPPTPHAMIASYMERILVEYQADPNDRTAP